MKLKKCGKNLTTKLLSILIILFCCCPAAWAQAVLPDNVTVTFPKGTITLSEAFQSIEHQTPFRFAFTGGKLDVSKKAELSKTEYTLTEIVDHLLLGTGYKYTLRRRHFIVVPGPEPQRAAPIADAVQSPIVIDDRDLKRFVPGEQRGADSVIHLTTQAGPFRWGAPDRFYSTPGNVITGGEVPHAFATAQRGQRSKFALKTNLLYGGAALAPNLRAEFGLGNRSTLEVGVSYNGWNLEGTRGNNKKLVHGIGIAEYRYWLCERFSGHFLGVHALGAFYNVSGRSVPLLFKKEFRYEGIAFGGGVSYGYALPFSARWGMEFNIGVGAAYMKYDKYGCDKCNDKIGSYSKTYIGPTRAGINLIFIIK